MIYTFHDTTDHTAPEAILPAEAVCFNGHWLDNEVTGFRTLSVSGRELMGQELDTYQIGGMDGEVLRRTNYPPRTITVKYQLMAQGDSAFRAAYNQLNALLRAKNAMLIFADEPDKYFLATKAGNSDVDPGLNRVVGEIEFFCADPHKYALVPKEFTAAAVSGVLTATVENDGTVPVPIDYEITMNSDNGYVGIVSDTGAMQYGSIEEADGETYTASEKLIDMAAIKAAADDHGGCYCQPDVSTNGRLGNDPTTGYLSLTSAGSGSVWHGGQKTLAIPADSQGVTGAVNCYLNMRSYIQCSAWNQAGFQSFAFIANDNSVIAAVKLYKTSKANGTSYCAFYGNGQRLAEYEWEAGGDSKKNPYYITSGHNTMWKYGDRLTFYFAGKYLSYVIPEIRDTAVQKLQVTIAAFGSMAAIAQNSINYCDFYKANVEKWKDNPNRYASGDVMQIDGSKGEVSVNGLIRMGDEVTGTEYFKANPGENQIAFYNSTWASRITAKAKIREAWL